MKRLVIFMLVLTCWFTLTGCGEHPADLSGTPSEPTPASEKNPIAQYLTEEDGDLYLVLPISKRKVCVSDEYKAYLDQVDVDLLKTAEEKISNQAAQYVDEPSFYLLIEEGLLRLSAEVIVDIDPPLIKDVGDGDCVDQGCGIDHEHVFFSEWITK